MKGDGLDLSGWPLAMVAIVAIIAFAAVLLAMFDGYPWQNQDGDDD